VVTVQHEIGANVTSDLINAFMLNFEPVVCYHRL